ncbi:hypothetical protein SY83_07705 [Paenibacillus swuensis]|uniref:Uncharacterized protein n=1 Tax=Paenibacillus swuensis TaxID=1178515 RepID=A0A172THB3_9BACL|nr:hypothetical protein [Paenibacillus swuensis]ANE46173.1 hypothetical protein SY83_07705 [Paenibacillus swuensis]
MKGKTVYSVVAGLQGAAILTFMILLVKKYAFDDSSLITKQPMELLFYLFSAGVLVTLGLFMLDLVRKHFQYYREWE